MSNFINEIKKNRALGFALVSSIVVILAILVLTFEPFAEIPLYIINFKGDINNEDFRRHKKILK